MVAYYFPVHPAGIEPEVRVVIKRSHMGEANDSGPEVMRLLDIGYVENHVIHT